MSNFRNPLFDAFPDEQKDAIYSIIEARRDIRKFVPGEINPKTLQKILKAAHAAPSVGLSQPWNFIIVDSMDLRKKIHGCFTRSNQKQAERLAGNQKEALYRSLKLEGILESSINIAVTCKPNEKEFILGRGPMPETTFYSTCLAIENLWLAARAEGIGIGWVSIIEKTEVEELLNLPPEVKLVAYLCVGYASEFRPRPMLEEIGWKDREPFFETLYYNSWENHFTFAEERVHPSIGPGESDEEIERLARHEIDNKTKPPGSLGILEDIAVRLSIIQRTLSPNVSRKRMIVYAANHGVAKIGVSPFPQEVTEQMVLNYLQGGAGINVLARHAGINLHIVDVGVGAKWPPHVTADPRFFNRSIQSGTKNFLEEPAMSETELNAAIDAGREQVKLSFHDGIQLIGIGEMGIGNTTSSSALFSSLLHIPADQIVGRGAGANEETVQKKRAAVEQAIAKHDKSSIPSPGRYWLQHVGGFEIAAMTGTILEAAKLRLPIVIDGYIATAAAAAAFIIDPLTKKFCFFSHQSNEQAHKLVLRRLEVSPLLEFDMRLGEGTGAALAMPIIDAAAKIMCEMATFESAGVSTKSV